MRGERLVNVQIQHEIYSYYEPEWARLMREAVWKELKVKKQLEENLSIKLDFFMTKNRYEGLGMYDLDNMVKTAIDNLNANQGRIPRASKYPIYDDSYVVNIEATKTPIDEEDFRKEETHIQIWRWNEAKEKKGKI